MYLCQVNLVTGYYKLKKIESICISITFVSMNVQKFIHVSYKNIRKLLSFVLTQWKYYF